MIKEPLVSRKCLFGTDCLEEIRGANAGEESEADHDMEPSVHNISECPLCILFSGLVSSRLRNTSYHIFQLADSLLSSSLWLFEALVLRSLEKMG